MALKGCCLVWAVRVDGIVSQAIKSQSWCMLFLLRVSACYYYYFIPCMFCFFFFFYCIGKSKGSTLLLRQDEAVQTTRPGVPEG